MLRYRAASFFASLNCPEITLGFYTQEEVVDNDMYVEEPVKDIIQVQNEVKADVKANANAVEFIPEPHFV